MSALKPYPHYEINIKDNSIYTFSIEETLPVHRAMWILRTQEGQAGVPTWCASASVLYKKFGEQTLNQANSDYASPQSFFLSQTMQSNGAFIVRALDASAKYATAVLEAVVTKDAPITQYKIDEDPSSVTYGSRIKDLDPDSDSYGQYEAQTDSDGNAVTEPGILITYRIREATTAEYDPSNYINTLDSLAVATDSDGNTVYPILAITASNPGNYGNDLAFRFFNLASENSATTLAYYSTIFNSFCSVRREYNSSTANVIYDIYGREYNTFSADPDCTDSETAIAYDMDSIITNAFDVDSSTGTDFPFTVYTYEANLESIGNQIIEIEKSYDVAATSTDTYIITSDTVFAEDKDYYRYANGEYPLATDYTVGDAVTAGTYYELFVVETEAVDNSATLAYEDLGYASVDELNGYQINVLGGTNVNSETYNHVAIKGRVYGGDALESDEVLLDSSIDIYLQGGTDGELEGASEYDRDNFVDQYTYKFLKLYVNPEIVDKFRYPITHLYDPGFSMTTKYAMIDFLDIRDDVGIELSTQVLFPNEWVTGFVNDVSLNDQAEDIANGLVLRERALLMRESILRGTDCMRCSIYTQAGKPVSSTYNDPVPFTYWSALKHAAAGNTDQMSKTEPRGLPNAYNLVFSTWNWINYNENMKEKTWDSGLNYCQYADTTRIFYPALRTVYRASTSSLVDQWVVDSLIYTKHECRKAWARFSGRNDTQAILEAYIKAYLEEQLAYLYNGKYEFEVTVYRTDEDNDLGYVERVKLKLTYPGTMRVMAFDIEVNREGYDSESEA